MADLSLKEHHLPDYGPRTYHNAKSAGLTVAFAIDFMTYGEKLTRQAAGDYYVAIHLNESVEESAIKLLDALREHQAKILNIAGNGIYSLKYKGWTQPRVNQHIFQILQKVLPQYSLSKIISGGQTGVDIAGIVAAHALGVPAEATFPKGFRQRYLDKKEYYHTEMQIRKMVEEGSRALLPHPVGQPHMGSLRVTSKRVGGLAAQPHETVMDGDRNNRIFGNRFFLHNHQDNQEREHVIGNHYYATFEPDLARKGPIYQEMIRLAEEVKMGKQIALQCWCAPRHCHLDHVAEGIQAIIRGEDIAAKSQQRMKEQAENLKNSNIEAFWGKDDIGSNFHPAPLTIWDLSFPTSEHAYMFAKARHFNDQASMALILKAPSPEEAKKLGKLVKGFDSDIWDVISQDIMYEVVLAKMQQNHAMGQYLINTGNKQLVEASPFDHKWGAGIHQNDPRILTPEKWWGENRLGNVMTRVRTTLQNTLTLTP